MKEQYLGLALSMSMHFWKGLGWCKPWSDSRRSRWGRRLWRKEARSIITDNGAHVIFRYRTNNCYIEMKGQTSSFELLKKVQPGGCLFDDMVNNNMGGPRKGWVKDKGVLQAV